MKKADRKELKLKESKRINKLVDEAYDEWQKKKAVQNFIFQFLINKETSSDRAEKLARILHGNYGISSK